MHIFIRYFFVDLRQQASFLLMALCVYTWLYIVYAKFAGSSAGRIFYCFLCTSLYAYFFSILPKVELLIPLLSRHLVIPVRHQTSQRLTSEAAKLSAVHKSITCASFLLSSVFLLLTNEVVMLRVVYEWFKPAWEIAHTGAFYPQMTLSNRNSRFFCWRQACPRFFSLLRITSRLNTRGRYATIEVIRLSVVFRTGIRTHARS